MADNNDRLGIKLDIGRRSISVTIPRNMEQLYRDAGKLINQRINTYATRYPDKDHEQFLCMALIDIALMYKRNEAKNNTQPYDAAITQLTSEIEELIGDKRKK